MSKKTYHVCNYINMFCVHTNKIEIYTNKKYVFKMYKILFYYRNNECWTRIIKTSKNHPNSYKPDLTQKTL